MGKLAEMIEARFGFHIRAEFPPYAEALSTTAEQILKANPDRVNWIIFNLGTTAVYLSHEPVPTSTDGYYLDKNGGYLSMTWDEDGELVGYPLYAVAESLTPTIFLAAVVAG